MAKDKRAEFVRLRRAMLVLEMELEMLKRTACISPERTSFPYRDRLVQQLAADDSCGGGLPDSAVSNSASTNSAPRPASEHARADEELATTTTAIHIGSLTYPRSHGKFRPAKG